LGLEAYTLLAKMASLSRVSVVRNVHFGFFAAGPSVY